MFNLAQVICAHADPYVQHELDRTRRLIVQQLNLHIKSPIGARVVARRVHARTVIWSDIQITPEITVDGGLANNAVLASLVRNLRSLLRTQVSMVNTLTQPRRCTMR